MEEKTLKALKWIVGILNKHSIEYRIGGGFAAHLYGSPRTVKDIDFAISEKNFSKIMREISQYVTYGPAHYEDGKWDCELITLMYNDQEIDISGVDGLKISNKERTKWISLNTEKYWKRITMNVGGIDIEVMNPRALLEYKRELDGDSQQVDINAIEQYLVKNRL